MWNSGVFISRGFYHFLEIQQFPSVFDLKSVDLSSNYDLGFVKFGFLIQLLYDDSFCFNHTEQLSLRMWFASSLFKPVKESRRSRRFFMTL
ncbi:hypothetical protein CARUB_v10002350mg [Capsella rubella]|uniref:Uncharacterized protein n=1 Tax=Capsella rubella TaxID=81985 RepID=R0GYA0_9BRAS|nr:hypothetical protein CARUB_v10002350mg [Capsella rubella]